MKYVSLCFLTLFFLVFYGVTPGHATIDEEIDHVYTRLSVFASSPEYDLYFKREEVSQQLREELLHEYGKDSRLFSFPMLDIETFKSTLQGLRKKQADESCSPSVLVHCWSFLSGIRVLCFKQRSDYFYDNKHLLPKFYPEMYSQYDGHPDPVVRFAPGNVCVKASVNDGDVNEQETDAELGEPEGAPEHLHYDVFPKEAHSILFYRSNYGKKSLKGQCESPLLISSMIKPSTTSLDEFDGDTLFAFLSSILSVHEEDESPMYSLGVIATLRNTAVYFSCEDGPGRIITSPSSVATVGYLGLMDGIFIEGPTESQSVNYLMALQLFKRGLHSRHDSGHAVVDYKPRVTVEEALKIHLIGLEKKKFAELFNGYVEAGGAPNFEQQFTQFIKELNEGQLSIPLTQAVEDPWILPEDEVDASGLTLDKKYDNRISDDFICSAIRPEEGERLLPVSELLAHLQCYDYQGIKSLNLSGNYICDGGGAAIADILAQNVLPELEVLDLSYNRIGDSVLHHFVPLLKRPSLHHLIITSNYLSFAGINEVIPLGSYLRTKIIWMPETWVRSNKTKNIPDEEYQSHREFYSL